MVDSQPHHNPAFAGIPFSIVIDHHPAVPEHPVDAAYVDIRPQYGAVSTLLTEYLRAYHIRPGIRLATALQYGIRTDTATFTRTGTEIDLRAYQYLAAHGDTALLTRITRSEYLPEWLKYFARAFSSMHQCGSGAYCYLDTVENPDILVVVADFFTHVHSIKWVGVCGVYNDTVVVIFRGDGHVDLGEFAASRLGALGNAGGHRALARAEFPLEATEGRSVDVFVFRKLTEKPQKKKLKTLRVWRGKRKSRVWIWNRGREPFKKGVPSPPPLSLLNFSDCIESLFAAFPFCQGTGRGVFS